MKKILLFSLLLAMTFVTTSLKAADGDVFTAPVTVIYAGETQQVTMRFKVTNESNKSCLVYGVYDEVSHTSNPAINYTQRGDVIIPENVNGYTVIAIGSDAFHGCYLEGIQLPETIKAIYAEAFEESDLLEIDLPSSVAYVGGFCFAYCSRLISAKISGTIENGCFYNCPRLEQIEFKSPVTSVGEVAFTSCTSLRSITFPSGLKTIDMGAFGDCKTLAEVSLPSSTESINASAFWGCTNLRNVVIARETPPTIDPNENSVLFADVFSSAVLHVPDKTKYTSESWASNFSEIRSFLPTNEKTYGFYNLGASGWGWIVYTNDPNKVLDLKIDGEPKAPTFYGTNIIVSDDPKQIPLEVSYLLKTDEGIQPNIIHYDLFDYGFSINGKAMTSRDFYNVPGVVSGKAYIKDEFVLGGENNLRWKKEPKLVLENATLEWNDVSYGLYNENCYDLTIKVIGDCTIKNNKSDGVAFELDVATATYIVGGGTLHILSNLTCIETWVATTLRIQDNTTVIAESTNGRGFYDGDGVHLTVKDGGVFAAYSRYEPIDLDTNAEVTFGEGIGIRYPEGAYFGEYNYVYYADGTKVQGDWVVIGPDNQKTQDLIAEINNAKRELGFSINGKEMTGADVNDVPGVTSGSAHIEVNEDGAPTLVLDNATLEWDTTGYGLHNHDTGQDGLTIKVQGDCTIKVPNAVAALEIDVARMITIEGGGTLNIISGKYPIETYIASTLRIQDNTTVIAKSENGYSAVWDQDGANIEIRDGGVFAAFGKYEPIWLDSNGEFILGEGVALRYPSDAYIGSNNNIYYADGTKVENDWVVFGPDNATTWELIDGVDEIVSSRQPADDGFIYNLAGQKISNSQFIIHNSKLPRGIYIQNGKKVIRK